MSQYKGPVRDNEVSALRQIWRNFGTTVSVIATNTADGRRAMLATAVTSLSLDPPSLVVCVNKSASAHDGLLNRGAYSVGLLSPEQQELAVHIASATTKARFDLGDWQNLDDADPLLDGLPYLEEAQATLFCRIEKTLDYGTHTIIVGRVAYLSHDVRDYALQYCDGKFGRFVAG